MKLLQRRRLALAVATMAAGALVAGGLSPATTSAAERPICTGTIRGTIKDLQGHGLAKVPVVLSYTANAGGKTLSTSTRSDGSYEVRSLCPGRVDVDAGWSDFRGYSNEYAHTMAVNGHVETIDFVLKNVGKLTVKVANETVFRTVDVSVSGPAGTVATSMPTRYSSSAGGIHEFTMPPGSYRVVVRQIRARDRISIVGTRSKMVTIQHLKQSNTQFAIDRGGAIKGKVKPRPKFCKKARCGYVTVKSDRGFVAKAYVNKYGSFRIQNLPPGKYKVHMVANRSPKKKAADYYRAGRSKVTTVTVKQGKTTLLKTTKLKPRYLGRPFALPWWV